MRCKKRILHAFWTVFFCQNSASFLNFAKRFLLVYEWFQADYVKKTYFLFLRDMEAKTPKGLLLAYKNWFWTKYDPPYIRYITYFEYLIFWLRIKKRLYVSDGIFTVVLEFVYSLLKETTFWTEFQPVCGCLTMRLSTVRASRHL